MSVSFFKHKKALIDAYKDVLDDGSDTDWALFTYEGKDNELKVAGTGDDGLEELESEFNSSKIMYAFIRVKDPKTSLHKFIFLHWQGEGAPANRKGACANHVRDVERFFKGAHITINARNEDDVTPEQIMEQVNRASASTYAFDKQQSGDYDAPSQPVGSVYKKTNAAQDINSLRKQGGGCDAPSGPVGSVYQKTNAAQDINALKKQGGGYNAPSHPVGSVYKKTNAAEDISAIRKQSGNYESESKPVGSVYQRTNAAQEISSSKNDNYWSKQDREEQERRKEDQKKKAEERQKYMEEVKAQEKESAQRRLQWEKQREKHISEKMRAARLADDRSEAIKQEKARYEAEQQEFEAASERGRKRSESIEKAAEAAHLAQQRGDNPRAMWQQKIADANKPAPVPERKGLRNRVGSIENYQPPLEEDGNAFQDTPSHYDDISHGAIPENESTFHDQQPTYHEPHPTAPEPEQAYHEPETYQDVSYQHPPEHAPMHEADATYDDASGGAYSQQQEASQPEETYADVETEYRARALYDYQAADDTEITFDPDDIITNISMIDEGWWQGTAPNGAYGLFPANYVELIN